jgi:DNA polymerase-1
MPPTLYLIDGHALAYRTYFALTRGDATRFQTSQGEPTAGIYGFISVLLRILERENPDYLAVAFDTGKTFRDEIFPDYKGTREKMPDDLRSQIERIRQIVDAFNIPRLEAENYEADDVLGSVAKQAKTHGLGVKIFTGDRDLLQLVDKRIIVNLPGKSLSDARDFLEEDVIDYLGVRPDQIVDYKALVGDKSDNIPGVAGIGEKTAVKLLLEYDTLDGIYTHISDIQGSARKKLEAGRDSAYISRRLAEIVTTLDIPLDLDQARPDHFNPANVESILRELEFRTLMERLQALKKAYGLEGSDIGEQLPLFIDRTPANVSIGVAESQIKSKLIDDLKALESLVKRLEQADEISFDTETTSTDQMSAELVGISLAIEGDRGYYIPIGHQPHLGTQLTVDSVLSALRKPMTASKIPKVGHNIKYDYVILARYGLTVQPLGFDTMIAEWLINPNSRNLGLKNLAWVRLGYQMTNISELIGSGKKQLSMAEVPIAKAADYASADAAIVLQLIPQLKEELSNRAAIPIFDEIEMPLIPVLANMEMAGIALDTGFLRDMSKELNTRINEIAIQIYQITGEEFNLNSPQQLSQVLFDRLNLSPPGRARKTATGFYSTAANILESMSGAHPIIDLVLEYRELAKLQSTYLEALPTQLNSQTGRVHTSFNQTGSVTGRIASSDPNLQNIPIRTEIGRKVRQAFIAGPDYQLLSVDYSQVELRIVAHIAQDEAMLAAFRSGQDIHATTAAAIHDIPLDEVSKEQRRHAKAINFGLIYGMSPFGLTRTTDLTLAEAEDFVQAYFERFPGVKNYLDSTRRLATEQSYVETLLGRRRYFPGLANQTNRNTRNREEREAINAPIQGTAADIMKIAMIRLPDALNAAKLRGKILLQVHDELVLECPTEEVNRTAKLVMQIMSDAYPLSIPLATEARSGKNWGELVVIGS